jgi:hypothetical protein
LKALQANQLPYSHLPEQLKDLEQKMNSGRATAEKRRRHSRRPKQQQITSNRRKRKWRRGLRMGNWSATRLRSMSSMKSSDKKAVAYRKRIIDLLTTPLEKMLESRKATLLAVLDTGAQISRIPQGLVFKEANQTALEQQLQSMNAELEEMGG